MSVESLQLPKCKYTLKTIFPQPKNRLKNNPFRSLANDNLKRIMMQNSVLGIWTTVISMYWTQYFYHFRIGRKTPPLVKFNTIKCLAIQVVKHHPILFSVLLLYYISTLIWICVLSSLLCFRVNSWLAFSEQNQKILQ